MTRDIADAALMMGVLSQPDARDHMSLPFQDFDWLNLELDVRGLRIGLQLEAGCGLPLDPEIRAAVEAAARLFESAGAIVTPLKPWMTPEMLDGVDRFWRTRSAIDLGALPQARRDKILPFIRAWAESGGGQSGEAVFRSYYETLNVRARTVAATAPYDYVLSPVAPVVAYNAEWAAPTNEVATTMHHIGYTLPYNMSEQPAASVNCGYTKSGLPIGLQIAGARFDDLGVLRVARAWERMRPAQQPWPQPPRA
jgi:aspartyl-tRNA(Asn)/glutamyl-tRNA(Gln) amidotransferase subunit A